MEALTTLFDQIRPIPILTREQERRLYLRIQEGDQSARNELVEHNIKLVVSIAKKYRTADTPLEDLINEGTLGLIRAAELFDARTGYKFSTYATLWIKQAIRRSLMEKSRTIRLPHWINENLTKIRKAENEIEALTGEEPAIEEIAETTGLSIDHVEQALTAEKSMTSMEAEIGGTDGLTVGETIAAGQIAPDPLTEREEGRQLEDLLASPVFSTLTDRQRDILLCRHVDGMTLEEVGAHLGMSKQGVQAHEAAAMRKLRDRAPAVRKAVADLA